MLEEYKMQYAKYADTYLGEGWREENKNILFNKIAQKIHNYTLFVDFIHNSSI